MRVRKAIHDCNRRRDPDDDYLITLARAAGADYLVSGDHHLTGLADPTPPVLTPREFRDRLTEASSA